MFCIHPIKGVVMLKQLDPTLERRRIIVQGIVQGVGFRPFVYSKAVRWGLAGFVLNDSRGVTIEVEGNLNALDGFERALREEAPPLARVDSVIATHLSTAPTADRASRLSRTFPMIVTRPLCASSQCVLTASANLTIRSIGAFTRNPMPVLFAVPSCASSIGQQGKAMQIQLPWQLSDSQQALSWRSRD